MVERYNSNIEKQTQAFFNRPSEQVVTELADFEYEYLVQEEEWTPGNGKIIEVNKGEETKKYRILLAEPYFEKHPEKPLKGKRLEQIKQMRPGEIVTLTYRIGIITVVKTRGGDSILLRELEDLKTHEVFKNPTLVSMALGLNPQDHGELRLTDENTLELKKSR